jgi:outer membrane protein OmpA-like peptidoglycan-associated protein
MIRLWLMLALACATLSARAAEDPVSQSVTQLTLELDALDRESRDGNPAALERLQARQALERIQALRPRDRQAALEDARVLVSTADFAVKASQLKDQLVALDRERDAILVEAARRDAALARKEAERLRLQALAREEEQLLIAELESGTAAGPAQAALDPASGEQTKRVAEAKAKEAELARLEEELSAQMSAPGDVLKSRVNAGKTVYTVSGTAFEPGKATLTPAARDALRTLSKKLTASGKAWSVEGHLDAIGLEPFNLQFSKKRADAVVALLKSGGVPATKLIARGVGSAKPVASNQSKTGRAQNRRIEIIQK